MEGSPFRNSSAQGSARFLIKPNLALSGRAWGTDSFRSLVENPTFSEPVLVNFPATGIVPERALPVSRLEVFERGEPYDAGNATFVPDQIDPDNRLSTRFLATAVTLRHDIAPGSSYQFSFQSIRTGRRYQDGPAGPGMFDPAISNDSRYDGQTETFLARTATTVSANSTLSASATSSSGKATPTSMPRSALRRSITALTLTRPATLYSHKTRCG